MTLAAAALLLVQAAGGELPPVGTGTAPAAPVLAEACAGKLYEAFDFWIGDWTVFTKHDGKLVGRSTVEKINNGCALRETWRPEQGRPGGTINAPDLITGRWHQYWVDAAGTRVDLEGGLYHGSMVLSGSWQRVNGSGQNAVLRMTYTRLDRDSIRQLAEFSNDDGLTWEVSFDYLYLRAAKAD